MGFVRSQLTIDLVIDSRIF